MYYVCRICRIGLRVQQAAEQSDWLQRSLHLSTAAYPAETPRRITNSKARHVRIFLRSAVLHQRDRPIALLFHSYIRLGGHRVCMLDGGGLRWLKPQMYADTAET